MMNYVAQPGSDLGTRRPPMPQIFQMQQTPPPEMQWAAAQTFTGVRSDRLNFSDPLAPLGEASFYPAHSAGAEIDLDFGGFPETNATADGAPLAFGFGDPDEPFDAWLPF
jgi:hypothetical protein